MSLTVGARMITAGGTGGWFCFFLAAFVFITSVFIVLLYTMRCLPLRLLCVRNQLLGECYFRAQVCPTVLLLNHVLYPLIVHLGYGMKQDSESWHWKPLMFLRRFSFEKVSWGLGGCLHQCVQRLSETLSLPFESFCVIEDSV